MSVEVDDVELYELILIYLRSKEASLPILTHRSPHLANGDRGVIVEWIYHLCNHFRVSTGAQHLSVALFDYFIDSHHADKQGLYLVGAACLSIACKVEDIEINIPQASKLVQMIPLDDQTPTRFLKSTELLVLQHFDWQIHLPTEASFIDYYAASCLAMELENIADAQYRTTLTRYYNKWIAYFRDKTLLLDKLRGFRPSMVACGIVTASRISLVMQPDWPSYMTDLTDITRADLNDVISILLGPLDLSPNDFSCLDEDLQTEHQHKPTTPAANQPSTPTAAACNRGDAQSPSPRPNCPTSSAIGASTQPGMAGDQLLHPHHHHHHLRPTSSASAASSSSYHHHQRLTTTASRNNRASTISNTPVGAMVAASTRRSSGGQNAIDNPSLGVARGSPSSSVGGEGYMTSRRRSRRKLHH